MLRRCVCVGCCCAVCNVRTPLRAQGPPSAKKRQSTVFHIGPREPPKAPALAAGSAAVSGHAPCRLGMAGRALSSGCAKCVCAPIARREGGVQRLHNLSRHGNGHTQQLFLTPILVCLRSLLEWRNHESSCMGRQERPLLDEPPLTAASDRKAIDDMRPDPRRAAEAHRDLDSRIRPLIPGFATAMLTECRPHPSEERQLPVGGG